MYILGEHVADRVEIEPMYCDQIGCIGDDGVDIAHQAQAFVEIGDVDAHRSPISSMKFRSSNETSGWIEFDGVVVGIPPDTLWELEEDH